MNRRHVALLIAVIVAILLLGIQAYRYWGGDAGSAGSAGDSGRQTQVPPTADPDASGIAFQSGMD